jgi:cysteine desulfurase / selenocysteine lyase
MNISELRHTMRARRADFPILDSTINGKPLVYLDNGASTQRPLAVVEAERHYALTTHANVHRGVHTLSQRATDAYEGARERVRRFINARSSDEVIFTKGTTESINLIAQTFGRLLTAGDEIVISHLEHHANIVPWQMLRESHGVILNVIPMTERGELDLNAAAALITERTKLLAVTMISNALGTIVPVHDLIRMARAKGVPVLLDAAQAIGHQPIDVQALDCDFLAFSAHKLYGPDGLGVLYGKRDRLNALPPWQGGGDMILSVSFEKTIYNELPYRLEAGTPHMSGAVGLAAAIDYVEGLGFERILPWEQHLLALATQRLSAIPTLRILGTAARKASVLSFVIDGIHPHDIGTILNEEGVAIRTGHHCAQPAIDYFKVPATARASFAFYNTEDEVEALAVAIEKTIALFE